MHLDNGGKVLGKAGEECGNLGHFTVNCIMMCGYMYMSVTLVSVHIYAKTYPRSLCILCVYIYVCVYIYIYIRMHVYIYKHISTQDVHLLCVCVCVCVCIIYIHI
jgi:hypothetical protein